MQNAPATDTRKYEHNWIAQQLGKGVGLNLWNCTGYSLTLTFTAEQARAIARELLVEADKVPRVGTAADLGCMVL